MDKFKVAIIGGGASGLITALSLAEKGIENVVLIERNDRLGKKLSSTGNGQGNITNSSIESTNYHSVEKDNSEFIKSVYSNFDRDNLLKFFFDLGGLFCEDERGRIYPSSKQASSVTDLLRFKLSNTQTKVFLSTKVEKISKSDRNFLLALSNNEMISAENVVLCCGGMSAKNFGTDGNGYDLAKLFKHTTTKLYPSLVQLKCKEVYKNLKGVRVDTVLNAFIKDKKFASTKGEVIFTEYGLSGNAVFSLTPYIVDKENVTIEIEFLPDISLQDLSAFILNKMTSQPNLAICELLCCVINSQIGKAILKKLNIQQDLLCKEIDRKVALDIAVLIKSMKFEVAGSLGYDYSQVTKGGVKLSEIDETLMSRNVDGLYFAGEILDVDGDCGGYNLQWAFSSGRKVALAIAEKETK